MPDITGGDVSMETEEVAQSNGDMTSLEDAIEAGKADPSLMDIDSHRQGQPELPTTVPRAYQQEILEEAVKRNVIAVLPTGVGKTLIGAMLIKKSLAELRIKTATDTLRVSRIPRR